MMNRKKLAEMLNKHEELLGQSHKFNCKKITIDLDWYMELVELAIDELHNNE
tara:strand:- start:193 stop:348 length:156 start_codon:yes stop_codon:yes gene_type:complete